MSPPDDSGLPRARIVKRPRWMFRTAWILPAVAAAVAIGLALQNMAREGPLVTVAFPSANGVVAGQTQVKYKDVPIGVVTAVHLSPDFATADVSVRVTREAASLMTDGASFWIVHPRVSLSEISGLGTLLSGNYIGFDRGSGTQERRHFIGLDSARSVSSGTPGRQFILRAADADNIDVGRPVYFRGVQVGQVASFDFTPGGSTVDLRVFVNAPYDTYVHPDTRFWNVSGVDVSVDGAGLSVHTESLVSVLVGGLAFENGPLSAAQPAAPRDAVFVLYRDQATAMKQPDPDERRYVLTFSESLQGVAVGAPVTFFGIPCGEVTQVGFMRDRRTGRMRGRLEITFSPERLIARLPPAEAREMQDIDRDPAKRKAFLRQMIVRDGLRAQLRQASLVSSERIVAFDYASHPPPVAMDWSQDPLELPVVAGTLPAFEDKLMAILDKLDALPLEPMAADARELMREARLAVASLDSVVRDVDEKALPEVVAAAADARRTLGAAQAMLDNASKTLVGPDAPGQRELRSALREVTRAARSLRVLSESIERQPESLLRGRRAEADSP
jgi:paraquat-inducible protein B